MPVFQRHRALDPYVERVNSWTSDEGWFDQLYIVLTSRGRNRGGLTLDTVRSVCSSKTSRLSDEMIDDDEMKHDDVLKLEC